MEKQKIYETNQIELCRNCSGKGNVLDSDFIGYDTVLEKCPVCDGSGRIVKMKEIKVTVRPFNEETDKMIK